MQSFEWIDTQSVQEAAALLAASHPRGAVVAKAGGLDLLDLMKEGIVQPARVVNLKTIGALEGIRLDDNKLHLGALATLAEIAEHPQIRAKYRALAEAAARAATPQVRNAATIGGNLLQRPRCWYFRSELFHSQMRELNPALKGENHYHAIFDNQKTAMVHASTPATALIAYGATVHLTGPDGRSRSIALQDFLLPPDMKRDRDTLLSQGEVLTHVTVPVPSADTCCAYHKQTERDSYDWPICDVAVVLQMQGPTVTAASIVLGWVAPTPRRATASEQLLLGRVLDEQAAGEAARAAVLGATPLTNNVYKVAVLEAVVRRTVLAAAHR